MEPTSAVVALWPPQLSPSFHPGVMPGISTDEGLALPCAACGLLRHPAPDFQLSLLGDCSKEEPQHLKVGRPMGRTIENQCSEGLILPYCEITGQHIFLTKTAPNGRRTRYLLGKLCSPSGRHSPCRHMRVPGCGALGRCGFGVFGEAESIASVDCLGLRRFCLSSDLSLCPR